jgi:hypothetical protein
MGTGDGMTSGSAALLKRRLMSEELENKTKNKTVLDNSCILPFQIKIHKINNCNPFAGPIMHPNQFFVARVMQI